MTPFQEFAKPAILYSAFIHPCENPLFEVLFTLVLGHDTTAAALSWALHMIGSHPEAQQKIQDEIDSVLGNKDSVNITQEDLRKMEFLERVIKESLRLFPSVPIIGRITSNDCE